MSGPVRGDSLGGQFVSAALNSAEPSFAFVSVLNAALHCRRKLLEPLDHDL
jgi:hypothetical protein